LKRPSARRKTKSKSRLVALRAPPAAAAAALRAAATSASTAAFLSALRLLSAGFAGAGVPAIGFAPTSLAAASVAAADVATASFAASAVIGTPLATATAAASTPRTVASVLLPWGSGTTVYTSFPTSALVTLAFASTTRPPAGALPVLGFSSSRVISPSITTGLLRNCNRHRCWLLSFLLVLVVLQVYILWNKYACGQPTLVGDLVLTVALVAVDPAVLYKALEGIDYFAK